MKTFFIGVIIIILSLVAFFTILERKDPQFPPEQTVEDLEKKLELSR